MSFRFGDESMPATVRVIRMLALLQAAILVLVAVFVVAVTAVVGQGNSISFGGHDLSGGAALLVGATYAAAGVACAMLAIATARRVSWARIVLVAVEVFLAGLLLFGTGMSISLVALECLCVSVIALLVWSR